jgi:hypothetical protein
MWSPLMTGRLNLIDQELFRCESELQYLVEAQEGGVGNERLGTDASTDSFFYTKLRWETLIDFFSKIHSLFENMAKRKPKIKEKCDYCKNVVLSDSTPYSNTRHNLTWLLEHNGESVWCKETQYSHETCYNLNIILDLYELLSRIYIFDTNWNVEMVNALSAAVIHEYKGW